MDPPIDVSFDHSPFQPVTQPVLFLVEGQYDVEFLRRISVKLSIKAPDVPNLATLEQSGRLVFVPVGGGSFMSWTSRFAPLACAEIHVYDREKSPETNLRRQAIEKVNSRSRCRAYLTSKRSLENYLHPQAILAAGGPTLELGDEDPVAELVGRSNFFGTDQEWDNLSRRTRKRIANRVKWWLNTVVVEHMSFELLRERDHQGDVLHWLQQVSILLQSQHPIANAEAHCH